MTAAALKALKGSIRKCVCCGKDYEVKRIWQKYCSPKCNTRTNKKKNACIDCGALIWRKSRRCESCHGKYLWRAGFCRPIFGQKRTMETRHHISESHRGSKNPSWKGGRKVVDGYVYIYFPIGNRKRYVAEHRLIMEKMLSRPLRDEEIVHHKNGNRADNRPQNLSLFPDRGKHLQFHMATNGKTS